MTRFALILSLLAALGAAPVAADVVPQMRPDDLLERYRAAATAAADVQEQVVQTEVEATTPDRAAIAAQISGAIRSCWNISNLTDEALAVRISVAFEATADGQLIRESIEMTNYENGTQDAAEEALGAAFRAIMRCAEMGLDLPPETHPIWQRVEMIFDAASMVTR